MGAYAIAYLFQLMAAQRISADRAGLLFLFEPVTAIAAAGLVLHETLSPLQMGGVLLILGALAAEILLGTRESFTETPDP
jgi:drug/metabolite transporter (DMT)-like permease